MLNVGQKVSLFSLKMVGYIELRRMFSFPVNVFHGHMLLLRRVIRS